MDLGLDLKFKKSPGLYLQNSRDFGHYFELSEGLICKFPFNESGPFKICTGYASRFALGRQDLCGFDLIQRALTTAFGLL